MQMPTVKEAIERMLVERHSSEIETIAEGLPLDNKQAVKRFCGQFDYLSDNPAWLMGALTGSGSNLVDILADVAFDKRLQEQQAQREDAEMMQDLARAQGF